MKRSIFLRKQRGNIYFIIIGAIIVLGMLGGISYGLDHRGYVRGVSETKNEWAAKDREAQAKADAERKTRQIEADKSAAHLEAANATAADYYDAWRKANAANRKPLSTCGKPAALPTLTARDGGAGMENSADNSGGITLTLTTEFVRQYDAAWTGKDGKPVFADPGLTPDEASGAATPAEVLATHAANAERCSKDRRRQNELIDLLLKLRAG